MTFGNTLVDFDNINQYAKFYQSIPHGSSDWASFTFSEFGPRQSLDHRQMTNIPHGSRDRAGFALDGKSSTDDKMAFGNPLG